MFARELFLGVQLRFLCILRGAPCFPNVLRSALRFFDIYITYNIYIYIYIYI